MTTPYTAGTVTLTNGSAVIAGIGTAWQTALIAGGILIAEADGNPLPILSVDSNTQITAAIKWKGASGTYPYAIMRDTAYGQQTVANAQALANYLTRLDTPTLSALNALGPSMIADRVPFATSNAAMAWAPFTSYGRTLVAATTDATFASAAKVVRRSGGSNMGASNDVMLGWHSTEGQLIAQIDAVPLGKVWTDYYATTAGAADMRSKIGAFSTAGGTVNGAVTVAGDLTLSGWVYANGGMVRINGASGSTRQVLLTTNGQARWGIEATAEAETGNNVGSNLGFSRYGEGPTWEGYAFSINRRYGIVETRQTPLMHCYAGQGTATLGAGQHHGILGSTFGFDFLRGGSGSAFTIGGNPGIGGRAVHIPVAGWYRLTACAVVNSPSPSVFGLGVNGNSWVAMYCPTNAWVSMTRTVIAYMNANSYISWCGITGSTVMSLENSSLSIEFIQF
ncbi:hypothetical protein [Ensifer sp. 22460]|uniref:hypothetical protein n=1 Tax=Ensifer sp. 22460 TaxID=3453922 RepID=UPI003F87D99E